MTTTATFPFAATDDCIWEDDAIYVGILLFDGRFCPGCGETWPANTDYFGPDNSARAAGGMTSHCRRCRRATAKASYARRRAATP